MGDGRPNIVVMVADDHGLDAGCYGHRAIHTPNIDALAADGVRFTHGFCTTASCAASRSVILTGVHNHTNGTYGHTHGRHHFLCFDDVVSLPVLLSRAGYHTARIGKYHVAPEHVFAFDQTLPSHGRDDVRMTEECRPVVEADPDETTNLADRPDCADLVRRCCARLKAFQEQTQDPWVRKWEYE
jgi:N-sulfoglucosamine sulfohydrolase